MSQEEYRENIETIIAFLSGRYREIERDLEQQMKDASAEQEFERAALMRNRLRAVRSLLERQRVTNEAVGTLDAIAVAAEGTDANAQVFQVRDGVLADRQSFYLENAAQREESEVLEEFVLQYYASALSIPPQVIVARDTDRTDVLAQALAERRDGAVEVRPAERGDKRRIVELAERNARLALDQDRLRSERRRTQRIEALDGLQQALRMEQIPMRIECFDISNLGETHTVASMVVFEGGAPKKSDYRRFHVRGSVQDDFAAMGEVLGRRMSQFNAQRELSPHEKAYDGSFAALPSLIVIDGGKGQLSAGLAELDDFRELGTTVISLAKQLEEVFVPGRPRAPAAPARERAPPAAPARSRRGAPLRDRLPPRPARQGDDPLRARRPTRRRTGAQTSDPRALRNPRALPRGQSRGVGGGARPAGQDGARDPRARAPRGLGGRAAVDVVLRVGEDRVDHVVLARI